MGDSFGDFDSTNIDTCRLLRESAFLQTCNAGPDGGIGQEVFIHERYFVNKPDGWETLDCMENWESCEAMSLPFGEIYYSKVFLPEEMEKSFGDKLLEYS